MNEKNSEVIHDARQLGIPKMLLLSIQHLFAMFGATILVPILVSNYFEEACGEPLTRGLSVSVTLFCAGVGTLIFHLCSKLKVPAFLGSSFAFLGGFETCAKLDTGIYAGMSVNDKAAYACGGIVIAGVLYLVLALIIRLVGVKRVMRFLPPVVTGPIIICIGMSLAGTAINNASKNWLLAIIALIVIIIFNIWGKGMFKIIPILMGVVISYIAALVMHFAGMTNPDGTAIFSFASISASGWVGIPNFQICKFDIISILVMAPIAIASMMEHIGDMSAISQRWMRILFPIPDFTEHWSVTGWQLPLQVQSVDLQILPMERIQEYWSFPRFMIPVLFGLQLYLLYYCRLFQNSQLLFPQCQLQSLGVYPLCFTV